ADSRGFSLQVRYSLSALPYSNGYRPRAADERVGYFPTVFRLPPVAGHTQAFDRYINRWYLQKQAPEAALSPPVEPIVFWLEDTVPPDYRDDLRDGALMWNKAFEQAGFENAIEVRQMPDEADWDPADVRYNVIRWIDTLRPNFVGYGPSRVNPLSGEILDADVLIDANVVSWLQRRFQTGGLDLPPTTVAYLEHCGQSVQDWAVQWAALQTGGEVGLNGVRQLFSGQQEPDGEDLGHLCRDVIGEQQTAFAALAVSTLPDLADVQLETFIHQYLLSLTAHEVGHALGLRHNFAGSQLLSPGELNDVAVTRSQGLVSSIMDYYPPNIAPVGTQQGDFFPTQLGPYDHWAIEYGYRESPAAVLPSEEQQMLRQILARSEEPALVYATDEDIFDDLDPEVGAWDLSSDPLQFATWQLDNSQAVWQRLNRRSVNRGEGYSSLRQRVDLVFRYFSMNTSTITHYIGGQRYRRLDPWTSRGSAPLSPIPAEKQRQALAVLNEKVFAADAFEFSPTLINQLPSDRWWHWGVAFSGFQLDYPIYERVLNLQSLTLSEVMLSGRLARLRDTALRTHESDLFTIAELF
ncbi:MAG: zinc-dependent metalloprotease, partial [Cyanobacteria bacterium P01_A01_bin.105]